MAAAALRLWRQFTREVEIPDGLAPERVWELRAEALALRRIPALLAEIAEAAEAENSGPMSFGEFRDLALSLLARTCFRVRDRRQDAVNLMGPFEARQWELGAVFVVGLVEKEFPVPTQESLFLNDSDRRAVEEGCGWPLPTSADRAREERLLFYVAVTRARHRLYLSHPQSDAAGRDLLPSFFLRDLAPLLTSEACARLERKRSEIVYPAELSANASDLLALVHSELAQGGAEGRSGPSGVADPGPGKQGASRNGRTHLAVALYEELRLRGDTRRAAWALSARPARLRLEAALERLRARAVTFSASDLRVFAQCAFRYFVEKTLALEGAPSPKELDYRLQGDIVHASIEQWERGGRREPIGAVLDRVFQEKTEQEGILPGHQAAKIRQEMRAALERFSAAEQQHDAVYRTALDQKYVELRFGQGWVPALEVELADGALIRIPGRVDRVEAVWAERKKLGLLVDYKYSASGFGQDSIEEIREGQALQLPIYLLALEKIFGLAPAGAEIYPLKAENACRNGVYDQSLVGHLFRGHPPEEAMVLAPPAFRELMVEGQRWIQRHATEIRNGRIDVLGKTDRQCQACAFLDLCRVTPWEVRREPEVAVAV